MPQAAFAAYRTRARVALDRLLPDKPVRRKVCGVEMLVPRRHLAPYFFTPGSSYGRNLVDLAKHLAQASGDLCMLDVGANIGDTTLLVLGEVGGSAVCVEPDPEWLRYLEVNVRGRDNIEVEASVLIANGDVDDTFAPMHGEAGSSFLERSDSGTLTAISPDELLRRHPQLADVRLIKSDTDGYDVALVPHLACTFRASAPVIFFEFDPRCTKLATPAVDQDAFWGQLADLGYDRAAVWNNFGELLGDWPTAEVVNHSGVLALTKEERGYGYWDVAVAHRDDAVGLQALGYATRARSKSSL